MEYGWFHSGCDWVSPVYCRHCRLTTNNLFQCIFHNVIDQPLASPKTLTLSMHWLVQMTIKCICDPEMRPYRKLHCVAPFRWMILNKFQWQYYLCRNQCVRFGVYEYQSYLCMMVVCTLGLIHSNYLLARNETSSSSVSLRCTSTENQAQPLLGALTQVSPSTRPLIGSADRFMCKYLCQ